MPVSKLTRSRPFITIAAVVLLGCAATAVARDPADASPAVPTWRADHHMHLGSPDLCQRVGDCIEAHQPSAVLASDAIAALDENSIHKGLVISSAYLYGLDSLELDETAAATWMRRENQFTAEQVRDHADRLVGFLSVDPRLPGAVEEIRHWQGSKELTGVKLHLSASAVDLSDAGHLRQLLAVIKQAAAQSLPLLVHIGGGEFDGEAAKIFIQQVLPATAPSWVQVAHAGGGWPFVDNHQNEVLRQFAEHIEQDDPATRKVLFDLSYVPAAEQADEQAKETADLMRRIGLERFLFGSDFNVLVPAQQIDALRRLQLSDEEWHTLQDNCAPWVCTDSP